MVDSSVEQYCIHLPDLSTKVTNEEIAKLFNVHVANVLIRPQNSLAQHLVDNERTSYEAWVLNVGIKHEAEELAKRVNGTQIPFTIIRCEAIVEQVKTFELCEHYRNGACRYSISCNKKHILCVKPITCENTECYYGHAPSRNVVSKHEPLSGRCESNESGENGESGTPFLPALSSRSENILKYSSPLLWQKNSLTHSRMRWRR
jgi:hypothetical protein